MSELAYDIKHIVYEQVPINIPKDMRVDDILVNPDKAQGSDIDAYDKMVRDIVNAVIKQLANTMLSMRDKEVEDLVL